MKWIKIYEMSKRNVANNSLCRTSLTWNDCLLWQGTERLQCNRTPGRCSDINSLSLMCLSAARVCMAETYGGSRVNIMTVIRVHGNYSLVLLLTPRAVNGCVNNISEQQHCTANTSQAEIYFRAHSFSQWWWKLKIQHLMLFHHTTIFQNSSRHTVSPLLWFNSFSWKQKRERL